MTPWWVPLLVGVLGILGVVYTQRRSDKREQATFDREMSRERERWEREDEKRTFEAKREVLVDLWVAAQDMAQRVTRSARSDTRKDDVMALIEFHRLLGGVQVYGTRPVFDAAYEAWDAAATWVGVEVSEQPVEEGDPAKAYGVARWELLAVIRHELGIPPLVDIVTSEGKT